MKKFELFYLWLKCMIIEASMAFTVFASVVIYDKVFKDWLELVY